MMHGHPPPAQMIGEMADDWRPGWCQSIRDDVVGMSEGSMYSMYSEMSSFSISMVPIAELRCCRLRLRMVKEVHKVLSVFAMMSG